jgi:predicted ester cyclase
MLNIDKLKFIADQLIVKGNYEIIDASFSENYIAHSGQKTFSGHVFIKQYTMQVRTALPDIKISKMEILTEVDHIITWQRYFEGTHIAKLRGIPASNKKVKWNDMVVSRFENEKIIEEWLISDLAFQLMLKLKS